MLSFNFVLFSLALAPLALGKLSPRVSSCDKQEIDTICSPTPDQALGPGPFDLKFKARPSTDYIELAFYSEDLTVKNAINQRYSTLEAGRDAVFKANEVYIPCGIESGKYILTVEDNYTDETGAPSGVAKNFGPYYITSDPNSPNCMVVDVAQEATGP